jgi:hypothetical protein
MPPARAIRFKSGSAPMPTRFGLSAPIPIAFGNAAVTRVAQATYSVRIGVGCFEERNSLHEMTILWDV